MHLDNTSIKAYNHIRPRNITRKLCYAPMHNLYFGQDGRVTACCYNRTFTLGQYPAQTLSEIWNGEKIKALQNEIGANHFATGCGYCNEQFDAANFSGLHASLYDRYADVRLDSISAANIMHIIKHKIKALFKRNYGQWSLPAGTSPLPRIMEFELSNICNLECAMCFGTFSSSIRKNRDQLPPLPMHYDSAFVEQLEAFLPHLWEAKFYGGEPFLIPIYYDIWESMMRMNPNIRINITTNGTVLNEKVKKILQKLNVALILSIDSFEKETYEAIRKNADYERVMENMQYFEKVAKEKQTVLSLAVCPVRPNWQEIPLIVQYCNEKNIKIYFNTVWYPAHLSLHNLSIEELNNICQYYNATKWEVHNTTQAENVNAFQSYVNQVNKWADTATAKAIAATEKTRQLAERRKVWQIKSAVPALHESSFTLDFRQDINPAALRAAAAEAPSPAIFIMAYFEALCEAIEAYAANPDPLQLAIRKSNAQTLCEQLLTQVDAADMIQQIINNNHEHTARYIIDMQLNEIMNPGEVFSDFTNT
ncbi:MAG TPA: twitch domain-containing radical SAM protein [Saprospiraceae bacterium]|nr:twitch domain-containing radical SAM protein [Saprospiraceae bacterium]HMP25593.1 twitch domain-containing radical SAM protein [Saprospiraceae bacterium]